MMKWEWEIKMSYVATYVHSLCFRVAVILRTLQNRAVWYRTVSRQTFKKKKVLLNLPNVNSNTSFLKNSRSTVLIFLKTLAIRTYCTVTGTYVYRMRIQKTKQNDDFDDHRIP